MSTKFRTIPQRLMIEKEETGLILLNGTYASITKLTTMATTRKSNDHLLVDYDHHRPSTLCV